MNYTLQHELDSGGFGERWACLFVVPMNAVEHTRGKKATPVESSIIIGEAFRTLAVSMSNYKHDKYVRPKKTPPIGWDSKANPEWHYLVEDMDALIKICCIAMKTDIDVKRYKIAIMRTQYNTSHYCLLVDNDLLINPDPSLTGPIVKYMSLS